MGGLINFHGVMNHFPPKGYKVWYPNFAIYDMPLLKTNVKSFCQISERFISATKDLEDVILLGNFPGGPYLVFFTPNYIQKWLRPLVITGSSGLNESAMGDGLPQAWLIWILKKKKATDVFFTIRKTTKRNCWRKFFATVNDRIKLVKNINL